MLFDLATNQEQNRKTKNKARKSSKKVMFVMREGIRSYNFNEKISFKPISILVNTEK